MANAPKGKRATTRSRVRKSGTPGDPRPASSDTDGSAPKRLPAAVDVVVDGDGDASPPWSMQSPAVWIERDPRTGQVTSIAHAGQPWIAVDPGLADDGLFAVATGYLRAVNDALELPGPWLDDLENASANSAKRVQLRWAPVDGDPRNSFRFVREDSNGKRLDETVVALACLAWPGSRPWLLHGAQGLRVTMHVDRPKRRPPRVRITSVATTLPPWTEDDLAPAFPWESAELDDDIFGPSLEGDVVETMNIRLTTLFGMPEGTEFPDWQFRYVPPAGAEVPRPEYIDLLTKSAPAPSELDGVSYALSLGIIEAGKVKLTPKSKIPLITHAVAPPMVKVFKVDPVTLLGAAAFRDVQPHTAGPELNNARTLAALDGVAQGSTPQMVQLSDGSDISVMNSALAGDASPKTQPKEIDPAAAYVARTNTQAAINSYYHFKSLFRRLEAYDIAVDQYFVFADRPLSVTYRGGIVPGGRGGRTVNAQVRWTINPGTFISAATGKLDTSLALADLRINPARAPLGIGCDPRWLWHEIGHVLLAAATGALEFRFAHSAGDALGAILHDPDSALAGDPAWRGITFPWVTLPGRHHDRRAIDGWSWSGTFNGRERDFATEVSDRRGYWTEQLLSSSLFRMYRALGGDAMKLDAQGKPDIDRAARRDAANCALFLIIKAIRLLGPASVAPAMTPENFVTALIDADVGTSTLASLPAAGKNPRVGGLAQKVIRWAFEQQGAYPDRARPYPRNRPGLPPGVDVYLDSKGRNGRARRGGYAPVLFGPGDWHARTDALWVQRNAAPVGVDQVPVRKKDTFVYVRVRNRGRVLAEDVTVAVFVAVVPASGIAPSWPNASKWIPLTTAAGGTVHDVPSGPGGTVFGPFKWRKPGAGTYALFATATCAPDRATTDPSSGWPCAEATAPSLPLALRVACDNNLGFRIVDVP